MPREIKFRAWCNKRKLMAYNIQKEYDTITEVYFWKNGIQMEEEPGEYCFDNYLGNSNYEVMQFTGLHDKNGKEIYEGDILKTEWGTGHIFDRLGCWFVSHQKELGYVPKYELEVIGNIYENPELLTT